MSFEELYNRSSQKKNLKHFASIVALAASDGNINEAERKALDRFAHKLQITEAELKVILKDPMNRPIEHVVSAAKRLENLFDLFRIVFADNVIDDDEMVLLKRYAIGLGYSVDKADKVIEKSVAIFSGKIDFEDYADLMDKD